LKSEAKMATKDKTTASKSIKFSDKFGLDKDRKKLGAVNTPAVGNKPELVYPGKNFKIVKITKGYTKKKYDVLDENEEIIRAKIPIVQFDVVHADGSTGKYYSPNTAVVEACENILADPDFGADKEGNLQTPAEIDDVISGSGEKGRNYIAFV